MISNNGYKKDGTIKGYKIFERVYSENGEANTIIKCNFCNSLECYPSEEKEGFLHLDLFVKNKKIDSFETDKYFTTKNEGEFCIQIMYNPDLEKENLLDIEYLKIK
jgi:hypothetical protein